MDLVDVKTGQLTAVPDEHAEEAVKSGAYGIPKGAAVPVKNRFGDVGTLDSAQAAAEIGKGRVSLATPGALQASRDERTYGGVGGGLAALGEGAVRGLTVGLSDPLALAAAGAIGGDDAREATRQHLAAVQRVNPGLSGVGEFAGTLAPAFLTGGAAEAPEGLSGLARMAGRGLSAPLRATEAIGGGVEAAARALAGDTASSALVRAAQKGIAYGARGATEGALFGAGQEISEEALGGDPDLTAEKLLASMGHGALLGGALGTVLGTGGELAKTAATALAEHMSPRLREFAEEQAARALTIGSDRKNQRRIEAVLPGGLNGMARQLLDDGVIGAVDTVDTLAPKVEAGMNRAGEKIDAMRALADASGSALPDADVVAERMRREMSRHLEAMPKTNAGAIGAINNLADDLVTSAGPSGKMTFQDLASFRGKVDEMIRWNPMKPGQPVNIPQEALKTARHIIENELEKGLEATEKHVGPGLLADYKAAKLEFRRYNEANNLVQEAVLRKTGNRSLSPSDYGMMGASLAGTVASGHPLSAIGSVAAGLAHKMVREHGNAFLATTLDKASHLGAIARASEQVDRDLSRGIRGFIGRATAKVGLLPGAPDRVQAFQRTSGKTTAEEYDERAGQVRAAINRPGSLPAHVAAVTAAMAPHAPNVANALMTAATRATAFLASKLPQPPPDNGVADLTGAKKWKPAEYDQRVFLRYARAVDDPVGEIHAMAKGRGTKQGAEAVRAVAPKLFAEAKKELLAEVSMLHERGKRVPSSERAALATLWDIPTDWSQTAAGRATIQQAVAQSNAAKDQQQSGPPPGHHSRQVATSKSSQMGPASSGIESARTGTAQ